jgi:hypothetical protein
VQRGSNDRGFNGPGLIVEAERLRVQKVEKPTTSVRYLEVEKAKAKANV